jgi:8-oxo-dGTP pyrophosphatase MutT (NUDIX family)
MAEGQSVTHAGGIVVRINGGVPEYLLVRAKAPPGAWVFPKGHIEPGESAEAAAIREVREEAGVSARPETLVGQLPAGEGTSAIYLMRFEAEGTPRERETAWLALEPAMTALAFEESRALLIRAHQAVAS